VWALAIAFLVTGGLVRAAATRPDRNARHEERKLAWLASVEQRGELTLDQAEDGSVLARKMKRDDLETKFAKAAASLKKHRS
jgi:hypothetical protein